MNDSPTAKRPRGTRWCSTGIVSAIIGTATVIIGLGGARLGLFGPLIAFTAFGIGLLAFAVSLISTLVGLILSKGTAGAASSQRAWTALTVAVLFFATSMALRPDTAGSVPIHDITTDIGNPPAFDAIIAFRADAPNPPEYAGKETAERQRAAYPDIQTLTIEKPTKDVFDAAEQVARDLGWEIVAVDRTSGRIEATDTTFWFRFKDDVVIRLTARGYGTYVDVRSKSRIGGGDMGTNARRIRTFLDRLTEATGG